MANEDLDKGQRTVTTAPTYNSFHLYEKKSRKFTLCYFISSLHSQLEPRRWCPKRTKALPQLTLDLRIMICMCSLNCQHL